MLQELRVKNYALIRNLVFRPEHGLNVITGETGAGKSILLGALGLILGNRADQATLLMQDEKCVVEGLFHLQDEMLKTWFLEEDLDWDEHLVLRREIVPGGKSRCFINDTPATLQQLKTLGEYLVEIQTQHAIVNLQDPNKQRKLLDDFVGNTGLLNTYIEVFRQFKQAKEQEAKLLAGQAAWLRERDYLQFQFQELDQFQPRSGEDQELEAEIVALSHSAEMTKTAWEACQLLDDAETGILTGINRLRILLKSGSRFQGAWTELYERAEQVFNELRDVSSVLNNFAAADAVAPEHLEALHERQFRLQALLKKHQQEDAAGLYDYMGALATKLQEGDALEALIQEQHQRCAALYEELLRLAAALSESRHQGKTAFGTQVTEVLQQLEMQDASMEVGLESLEEPGPFGTDAVGFRFRTAPTLPMNPLQKVASGGELARLMFAVQCISARKARLPLLIFDEADSGVSGEVASKFGSLMRQMAEAHQVIAITHLPQVAGAAHAHFYVYKEKEGEKLGSAMKKLAESERVEEIAVMISGKNPENSARLHAMTLLKNAATG
ncbi:MAG: repair protein RecN [Bacteroidota bacterium]|jgi:DNA repair protein RecN (Recombination protein N)